MEKKTMINTHSISFNGSSQYSKVNSNFGLTYTSSRTIEFKLKVNSQPSTNTFVIPFGLIFGTNPGNYTQLYYRNDANVYSLSNNTGASFSGQLATGVWYHIALTHDHGGNITNIYVNAIVGTSGTSFSSDYSATTSCLNIGAHAGNSPSFFTNCQIDDLRLWNTIRTQTQLLDNMNTELVGNETGLVGYWKLNNAYTDSTINGNTLTPTASPTFTTDIPFDKLDISTLTTGGDVDGGATATTGTIAWSPNDTLLLGVNSRTGITADPNIPTPTTTGLTWLTPTNYTTVYDADSSSRKRLSLFYAKPTVSGSGTTSLTFSSQNQTNIEWVIHKVIYADPTIPIVQSAVATDTDGGAVSATLSAFADTTNNAAFGLFGSDPGSGSMTPGAAFIELTDFNDTAIWTGSEWKTGEDTSVDATFASVAGARSGAVAIELKSAAKYPIGGTRTVDGDYTIHTFNSSGTFIAYNSGDIDILVVAGGGSGGGGGGAGGGGGGGLVYHNALSVTARSYTVTVGNGGNAPGVGNSGNNGQNSVFDVSGTPITALGGGGGGRRSNGVNGGSGGGAGASGASGFTGGTKTQGDSGGGTGFGNNGGNALAGYKSGGGGGAGAVGQNAGTNSGNGGDGKSYEIVTAGSGVYYAGGGGGGGADIETNPQRGLGGQGGGGNGSSTSASANGSPGTPNTGGGGGGGNAGATDGDGGAGGSGIVIVRYLTNDFRGIVTDIKDMLGSNSYIIVPR